MQKYTFYTVQLKDDNSIDLPDDAVLVSHERRNVSMSVNVEWKQFITYYIVNEWVNELQNKMNK